MDCHTNGGFNFWSSKPYLNESVLFVSAAYRRVCIPMFKCFQCCHFCHTRNWYRSSPNCCNVDRNMMINSVDYMISSLQISSHIAYIKCPKLIRQYNIKVHISQNSMSFHEASIHYVPSNLSYAATVTNSSKKEPQSNPDISPY